MSRVTVSGLLPVRGYQERMDELAETQVSPSEGEAFFKTPHPEYGNLQFCVLGQFKPNDEETPNRVEAVLKAHDVKLYRSDRIGRLIDEIQQTGKDLPAKPQ